MIYKKKQGLLLRWSTFICIALLMVFAAHSFYSYMFPGQDSPGLGERLNDPLFDPFIIPLIKFRIVVNYRLLISVLLGIVLIALGGYASFVHQRLSDFLIDTESELHKVSWPTFQKVLSSSIVVIITIIFLGLYLFIIDVSLYHLFNRIFHG